MPAKLLVLVDGSYYLFRAFYGMPELRNAQGEPTGAIVGVLNMLRRLTTDHRPDFLAVVFDAGGESFRNELYADYKANRPPIPEDLERQIEPILELIRAQGIPLLVIDGVEADDVIATLATQARAHGIDTLISSGDKDLMQLVDERVRVINTMNGAVYDRAGVTAKFGVPPERIVDYLALVGDNVDNVPGVPKVGPKTAAKWLAEYGSLDAVVRHAGDIGGKVGDSLRASLDRLPLARQLVTLKLDLALGVTPEQLTVGAPDGEKLAALYRRWGMKSRAAELDGSADRSAAPEHAEPDPATATPPAVAPPTAARRYETVLTMPQLDDWIDRLQRAELIAFDTETTSLDYMQARIVGVSFATTPHQAAYVPLAHDGPGAPPQLPRDAVLERLKPLLESAAPGKLGHHLKYDMNVLANHGIALGGLRHDTMLESYVLDAVATRHDMDSLAEKHLGEKTIHYEDVAGKGAKQIPFSQVPVDRAAEYAAEDADVTLRLHGVLWPRLRGQPGPRSVYQDIELPLVPVLSAMERNGVLVDGAALRRQSTELGQRLLELERQAHGVAGAPFNIGSPKQIQAVLYERLQLPVIEKTPKGQPSTAESALEELAAKHELPRLILEHRALSKLRSTYTDRLPEQIDTHTGRVHTSYHQAVAATGRLSSSDPNLQNIPIRTPEGRRIRQAFIAPPGHLLLSADYSQIELRIMAHLSADANLLAAFAAGADVHRATAAEVFGVTPDAVSTEQRRAAKAINFGLIYGMSPFGLAKQLGIERGAAKDHVERYFARYPAVRDFMERVKTQAREQGYVETVFQRRLYLPDIASRNPAVRQYAERTAINAPMQGTAADIIKRAMIALHAALPGACPGARMILQVHDELVFEVPEAETDALRALAIRLMAGAAELRVPLVVDTGTGANWDAAH
jgi:DNA polymerase-1